MPRTPAGNPPSWRTETRKVCDLLPWDRNPRAATKKEEQDLKRSLASFGVAEPVVVNVDGLVVVGHFRLRMLKEQGVEEVDVRVPDRELSPEECEELNLRLNRNTGHWDVGALGGFDREWLRSLGWDDKELDKIFQSALPTLLDQVAFECPDPRHEVRAGDRWQMGRHLLVCADVHKGHAVWAQELQPEDVLVPYAGPLAAFLKAGFERRLVMVQPDTLICGHALDTFEDLGGGTPEKL